MRILFEQKDLQNWVFHGGTALRIIHGLNRFSEDLDFHLKKPAANYSLTPAISSLIRSLALQGYSISEPSVKAKTVRSTFIKFEGLLFESGLSLDETQKLSIKLEVDANPPAGWQVKRLLVNAYFPYSVQHHDIPSFLSGKLHAILQRPYTKGRDFYDIVFILSRWQGIEPNLAYLHNALEQTGYTGEPLNQTSWKAVISTFAKGLNWPQIRKDVHPFLFSSTDLEFLDLDHLLDLLQ